MIRALLLLALVGCPRPTPTASRTHVHLVVIGTQPSADILASCNVWADYLGLTCGYDDSVQVECDRSWRHDGHVCQLTLGLTFEAGLIAKIKHAAESDRERRSARFDTTLLTAGTFKLRTAIAHELGHLILDTAEHTKTGIMSGGDATLSEDDKALAQRTR